jgi:hypothetical protein
VQISYETTGKVIASPWPNSIHAMPISVLLGEGCYQKTSVINKNVAIMNKDCVQPRVLVLACSKDLNKLKQKELIQDLTPLYHKYLNAKMTIK